MEKEISLRQQIDIRSFDPFCACYGVPRQGDHWYSFRSTVMHYMPRTYETQLSLLDGNSLI